jgi:hypothetical protein
VCPPQPHGTFTLFDGLRGLSAYGRRIRILGESSSAGLMRDRVTLLTAHARVLLCIFTHPEWTVHEIANALRTSERQLFRWLNDLQRSGYLERAKDGRRNRYLLRTDAAVLESPVGQLTLSDFLTLATRQAASSGDESAVEAHRLMLCFLG